MFAKIKHLAIISDNYVLLSRFYEALFGMKTSKSPRPESAVAIGDGYIGMNIIPQKLGRQAGLEHFGLEVEAYVENLRSLGVEADRDWKQLISMRHEEYARDKHEVRSTAMRIESAEKTLDLDSLSRIQLLLPVQAIAIGCHHHICRGNTDGRDDLFKQILKSLSKFYVELRVRLEGGKITPLMRARAAFKQMLQRWGKK
jgi:hypothetical protein